MHYFLTDYLPIA